MEVLFDVTTILAIALLGMLVPFFVFVTTLLGSAAKRVKAEEEGAKEEDKKDFDKDIDSLEEKIKEAKKSGSSQDLEKRLKELLNNRKKFRKQLKRIISKYNTIKFKGIVVYPGSFLLLTIISSCGSKIHFNKNIDIAIFLWVLSLSVLAEAIRRLCIGLSTVQEISISSDELRIKEQAKAYLEALKEHEESKAEQLAIRFINVDFPYKCKVSIDLTLNFRISLTQGKIVRNVTVWFFIPEEFNIINPDYFWRQGPDFKFPNIRTVKVRIGDVSIGPYITSSLKISPLKVGEYKFLYSIRGDGYNDPANEFTIKVEKIAEKI